MPKRSHSKSATDLEAPESTKKSTLAASLPITNSSNKVDSTKCAPHVLVIGVGTYEHTLRTWNMVSPSDELIASGIENGEATPSGPIKLTPLFHDTKHSSMIQSITSNSKWLVTGGRDEVLFLYNIRNHSFVGDVAMDGEATSIVLTETHMICSSTSGRVNVWKLGTWDVVATIAAHTRACHGVVLHPSKKLGISVGDDRCVAVLNFVKATKALEIKHREMAFGAAFACNGTAYALRKRTSVETVDTLTGATKQTYTVEANALAFLSDEYLVTGSQDGILAVWRVSDGSKVTQVSLGEEISNPSNGRTATPPSTDTAKATENNPTFSVRCRDLVVVAPSPSTALDGNTIAHAPQSAHVVAITSCGVVSVWSFSLETLDLRLLATGNRYASRFVCVTASWVQSLPSLKN